MKPISHRGLSALAATIVTTGGLLAVGAGPASAANVGDFAALQSAVGTCDGTLATPTIVNLSADITQPDGALPVNCVVILDLGAHDLSVSHVDIGSGQQLTVDADDTGSKLTANANSVFGQAGIANDGATLVVEGGTVQATGGFLAAGIGGGNGVDGGRTKITGGEVKATGGLGGSGIGGGQSGKGGTTQVVGGNLTATGGIFGSGIGGGQHGAGAAVTISAGATVTALASQEASAVGAGANGGGFGSLAVNGTLRLPFGSLFVPDSNPTDPEIAIGSTGVITGDQNNPTTGTTFYGSGQIDNEGSITFNRDLVLGSGPTVVLHHHYVVSFETEGGSADPADVYVLAKRFASGARDLPPAPTRSGFVFAGWNTAADGSGADVTATSALPGTSADGQPVQITAHAQWLPLIAGLASSITGTPREGKTLTAESGPVTPDGVTLSHQWYEDGRKISGATSETLELGKRQAARRISVRITASAPDRPTVVETSAQTPYVSSAYRRLVLSDYTIAHRASFKVAATGLKPGQKFIIWLGGRKAFTGRADSTGTVHESVRFSTAVEPGTRRVRVSGYASNGKRNYTIYTTVKYLKK